MRSYNLAEGVELLSEDGDSASLTVTIPLDDDGFFGRECGSCDQHFRIHGDDFEELPDDVKLWCTYCGHTDEPSEFTTKQQRERFERAIGDYAEQMIGNMFNETFGRMARRNRSMTYRSSPFYPAPLPGIDEESLVRERACTTCSIRYAVFGEHRFCPVCGLMPAIDAAVDALAAEETRLKVLSSLPAEQLEVVVESGILDRTRVDTIENIVGIVEAAAERIFIDRVANSAQLLKGKGKIFQRLNDMADLYLDHLNTDIRNNFAADWSDLEKCWAARHVFTHCDGIVDAKYLKVIPASPLREGQRLQVSEDLTDLALAQASKLIQTLQGV